MNSQTPSSRTWQVQCQWGSAGVKQCPETAGLVIAGICGNEHIETYAYCYQHHEDWLQWISLSEPSGKGWLWMCIQCQKPIVEHMSQPYEL